MSSISAGTSTGTALVSTGDTTGALVFKTGASATTAMTIGADQSVTFVGAVSGTPGSGGTTASGSVVLTSASTGAQSITTTNYGQSVTLPDATTLSKGACLYTIKNEGLFDLKIVNAAGTTKGFIRPLTTTNVGLADNATSAGTWIFDNAQILGISAFNEYVTTQQISIKQLAIDSSRDLLLLEATNGIYGLIYNKTTNVWGTVTLIRTAASLTSVFLKTATDQVLVVSCPYTTAVEAVVLTLTGTSITVGTAATATLAGALSTFNNFTSGGITTIGSTFVFSYTRATAISGIRAITISGTTPAIGAETTVSGTSVPARLYAVSASVLLTISILNSNSIYCVPYSVSGTTLTVGTGAVLPTTSNAFYTIPLGTRWAVVYLNTNSTASIINVTGTTATASTSTLNATANISDVTLVGTKIVVASINGATMYIRYFSDNSGTINVSNAITQVDQNSYAGVSLFPIDSNTAGASYFISGSRSYVSTIDISTATPVFSLKMLTGISSPAIITTTGSFSGVTGDIAALNFDGKWLTTNVDALSALYSGITLYTKSGAIIVPTMLLSVNSLAYAASNYAYFRSNFVGFSVCFQILEMAQ